MPLLNIINHHGYVKDTESGAIINNNDDEYKKYLAARESSKRSKDLSHRISEVENDLRDIKSLLEKLVHRNY